ncbi:hypothetical protein FHW88_000462 [Mucilaginibacter sp. SG538B]|nr:hypothetical protein [Mucilaginibacter sp. SG538B]
MTRSNFSSVMGISDNGGANMNTYSYSIGTSGYAEVSQEQVLSSVTFPNGTITFNYNGSQASLLSIVIANSSQTG